MQSECGTSPSEEHGRLAGGLFCLPACSRPGAVPSASRQLPGTDPNATCQVRGALPPPAPSSLPAPRSTHPAIWMALTQDGACHREARLEAKAAK